MLGLASVVSTDLFDHQERVHKDRKRVDLVFVGGQEAHYQPTILGLVVGAMAQRLVQDQGRCLLVWHIQDSATGTRARVVSCRTVAIEFGHDRGSEEKGYSGSGYPVH